MKPILAAVTAAAFILIGLGDADAQGARVASTVTVETPAPPPATRVTKPAPKVGVPAARPGTGLPMTTRRPEAPFGFKENNFYWNAFGGAD